MKNTLFMKQLSAYFNTYLPENKKCSKNTIAAYTDGFSLFFEFMYEKKSRLHYQIDYSEFTPQLFDEYILWMKNVKKYSPSTQKQRMAAITSFLKYASRREMSAISALNGVASAETPKIPDTIFPYFSVEEIRILLKTPDFNCNSGYRDMAILSLIYDAAARAQEICNLCVGDLILSAKPKVRLNGKGNKTREVPISNEVAKILRVYLKECGKTLVDNKNEPLFSSQRADKMTTACIRSLTNKYVSLAKKENPTLFNEKSYSPHSFRHSKAIHMLEAGVPLIYIRNFLGHESVKTTEKYARVSQAGLVKVLEERKVKSNVPKPQRKARKSNNLPDFMKN